LEDVEAPIAILRPVYYWITDKAEPMIHDFCAEYLLPRMSLARAGVGTAEAVAWLQSKGCRWSPTVTVKVARGLLATLRDFGVLEGRVVKRLATVRLPVGTFAYIALCLARSGRLGRQLVSCGDWQVFLLSISEVEHLFLEAHGHRLLEYYAAGSTFNIEFPVDSLEEYARVVIEKSHRTA
jgi:hypothetical protein